MKKIIKVLGVGFLLTSLFSFRDVNKPIEVGAYTNNDGETYYNGISSTSTGDALRDELNSLNSSKRKNTVGYGGLKTAYVSTDPGPTPGSVTAFYAGTSGSYSSGMNREHVWPDSLGGSSVEGDAHMTRPTWSSDNSSRGNEYYVEGKHGPSKPYKETGWDPGAFSNNDASYRGDAARIIFYCAIANKNLRIVDTDGSTKSDNTMGKLSDLLKWNINYPVKERERVRNEAVESLQGNRNPFIDNPSYACRIWGNTNDATRAICAGAHWDDNPPVTVPVLDFYLNEGSKPTKITSSEYSIKVGKSFSILSYANDGVASNLTWTLSGDSVVMNPSVDGGKIITGVKTGNSVVKISKSYVDETGATKNVEKSLTVKVSKTTTGGGGGVTDGRFELVNDISSVSTGDYVVLATNTSDGVGVTGFNDNKDATVTSESSNWMKFRATESSNGVTLFDTKENEYIATPTDNEFKYAEEGGVISVDNNGNCKCNNRFLCINGICYRFYKSIGSFTPFKVYKIVSDNPTPTKTVTNLASTGTNKTSYESGENFDPTGLTITATYSDGTSENVTDKVTWSSSSLVAGTTTVVGSYGENTVIIEVTVTGGGVIPVDATLVSISITTNPKTIYNVGEDFDPSGAVITATYSDGSTVDVTALATWSLGVISSSTKKVTVSYNGKTASLNLTINGASPTDVSGCAGSIATPAIILSLSATVGIGILFFIKRKEKWYQL